MAKVLITGGTGIIGQALTQELILKGHEVTVLTRKARPGANGINYKAWDPEKGTIDDAAIGEADCIVHLAGANVADGRWTSKRKQEIVDSRVKSGQLLVKALRTIPNRIETVISASAIGWYGPDPQIPNPKPFSEGDPADDSFLGQTCVQWEEAINGAQNLGKRLVYFRIGIVLSNEGGAYAEFKKPLRFGAATVLGSGKQIVSWIHIDDLVQIFLAAIETKEMRGVYNAVAPLPVSNRELIATMAKRRGALSLPVPVPSFALQLALGEMSVEVLKSATVSSRKLQDFGFRFSFPTITNAVEKLESKG